MSNQLLDPQTRTAAAVAPRTDAARPDVVGPAPAGPPEPSDAGVALRVWWKTRVPGGVRRALAQVGVTLLTLLIVLPLASLLGLIGGRTTTMTAPGAATMPGMASPAATGNASTKVPAHPTYDAQAPAALEGGTVNITLVTKEVTLAIAPGVAYQAWTFGGTVPGPILRVRQGQTIHFTLQNDDAMPHSIDFHAAQTPWSVNYQPVPPHSSFSFDWTANFPGVFMYHCGTPPAMVHMSNGMYGAIIVDPAGGWDAAQEYVLVQSEFYARQTTDGTYILDGTRMMNGTPNYVVFNGYANQYKDAPLTAKAGQKIRLFVVNAGPSQFSAFHVIGAIFSDVYLDGNPANHLQGEQTVTIPPGGAAMLELTIPQAGSYPFLTHSFAAADMGALGILKVTP